MRSPAEITGKFRAWILKNKNNKTIKTTINSRQEEGGKGDSGIAGQVEAESEVCSVVETMEEHLGTLSKIPFCRAVKEDKARKSNFRQGGSEMLLQG